MKTTRMKLNLSWTLMKVNFGNLKVYFAILTDRGQRPVMTQSKRMTRMTHRQSFLAVIATLSLMSATRVIDPTLSVATISAFSTILLETKSSIMLLSVRLRRQKAKNSNRNMCVISAIDMLVNNFIL